MVSQSRKTIITRASTMKVVILTCSTLTMLWKLYKPAKEPSTSKIRLACTLSSLKSSRSSNVILSQDITTPITLSLVTSPIITHLTVATSAR